MQREHQQKSTLTSAYLRRLKISHFATLLSPNFRVAKLNSLNSGRDLLRSIHGYRATDLYWAPQQPEPIFLVPPSAGPHGT